jgi:hypothetical protein
MVGASSTLFVGLYAIFYMVYHMDFKLLEDDMIYLGWCSLFLMFWALFTGGVSCIASAVFVT